MTVKAACNVQNVFPDPSNSGKIRLIIDVAGIDPGPGIVQTSILLDNVSPTISSVFLEADIKQGVKDELINNHGYTFGLLDSVRMINALV
jgi:hypothetical protein